VKDKPHDEAMVELYREESDFAIATLNAVLQDCDQAELMVVLRQMTKAFSGLQSVTDEAYLNSTQIYRIFSPDVYAGLRSFRAILGATNMRLAVQAAH
jgi:DNA-binding phage protein